MYNNQLQVRPYINLPQGTPPVNPQFPISQMMVPVAGYVGYKLVDILQREAIKNKPRNYVYNLLSDNGYNNPEFQYLYQIACGVLEITAMQHNQDPMAMIDGVVGDVVKGFIGYIWFKYYRNEMVEPDINQYLQASVQMHEQHVQLLNNRRLPNQQFNQYSYNQQYNQGNNPFYPKSPQPQVQPNVPQGYNQGYNQYPQHGPMPNNVYPQTNQPFHVTPMRTGNRFIQESQPSYPNTTPMGNNSAFHAVPMANTSSISRFSPTQESSNNFYPDRSNQIEKMEKAFETSAQVSTTTTLDSNTLESVFGSVTTPSVVPSVEVKEVIEWYPTPSQLYPIAYDPYQFTKEVVLNDKGHPIEQFRRIERGHMKEEDHITSVTSQLVKHGPVPTAEDIKKIEEIERNLKIVDEEKALLDEKAKKEPKFESLIPERSDMVEAYSKDDIIINTIKESILKDKEVYTTVGNVSIPFYSKEDLLLELKTFTHQTDFLSMVSRLTKLKEKQESALFSTLFDLYTDLTNRVIQDKLSLTTLTFDNLIDDASDLVKYLTDKGLDEAFKDLMKDELSKVFNVSLKNKELKDKQGQVYYENKIEIPITVTYIKQDSRVLGLPNDDKKVMTDVTHSPILSSLGEYIQKQNGEHYLVTMDRKVYRVVKPFFNKEVYYLKRS